VNSGVCVCVVCACAWVGGVCMRACVRACVCVGAWAKSDGAVRLRALLLLFIVVVSPCWCEPLRGGCCGGEGVLGVS